MYTHCRLQYTFTEMNALRLRAASEFVICEMTVTIDF